MRKKTRLALIGAALALAGSGASIPFAGPASASGASVSFVGVSGSNLADGGTVSITGSGFPARSADPEGLEIIECSDPGGSPSNLPTDASLGCDGSTVSGNQINTDSSGNMATTYQISQLNSTTSNIICDATHFCVLWVGVDYNNDFNDPSTQAFSSAFEAPTQSFTSAASASFPTFTTTTFTVHTTDFQNPTITETGALPSGVTFHDNGNGSATLSGKPSAVSNFPLTFRASNGGTVDATQSFVLSTGFKVTTTSLPPAHVGSAYSSGPITVSGGTAPYKYKVKGLPKGLKASKTNGAITGTATTKNKASSYTVTVTVTDAKIKSSTKHPNPSGHGKETATATLHLTLTH